MFEIIDVHNGNVDEKGFFCMRSKPKSKGYQNKLAWLKQRFQEDLKLKIIEEDGQPKGFIEYMPSEVAWRGINGNNYLIIHCLWIVGRGKGKGYGSKLLEACINDAKSQGKSGVAMITSSETWLADKSFFMKFGFESVEQASPCFELIVKRFDEEPIPRFNVGWDERASEYIEGITILKSDQCPYIEDAVKMILEVAEERSIQSQVIDLTDCEQAQSAPSAYGVFNVILNGRVLTYHPVTKREFNKLLDMSGV
ncbi:MAG: GNAT family N-acetyltransferase [Paenibacillus sp.]|nr:GNAT family N-acetyltransferase [Paenibacillus sp.]